MFYNNCPDTEKSEVKSYTAQRLVDLLNRGTVVVCTASAGAGAREAAWSATREAAGSTARSTTRSVELLHDGVGDALELLLLLLVLLLRGLL